MRLTTLGGATLSTISGAGAEEVLLGPGKPFAMLTYLALTPKHSSTRDHLIDLLWADVDPERARRTLRQTLWQIRTKLGEQAVEAHEETLTLAVDLTTDRHEFVDALRTGNAARALELYAGPFLPDFAVPGGGEFEQWADLERDRLHLAWVRTAESQVRSHLADSRNRDALRLARVLRDDDPLRERAWRLVLEVLVSTGDLTEAQLEADTLETMLRAEGREPEPATREAIRRAREDPAQLVQLPGPPSLVSELIGRSREFATIVHAWDAATHGPSRHIHLSAAPGIGKTRLLQDVAVRLRASGAATVQLRGNFGERQVPYAFAGDLTRSLARLPGAVGISQPAASAIVGLDPSLTGRFATAAAPTHGDEALRYRTIALVELLTAITEEEPLALLIDDIHWVDSHSRRILSGILHRVEAQRLLVVTAARPTGEADVETHRTELIALNPFGEDEVDQLLMSLGNIPDPKLAAELPTALHRTSAGSPLLVLETLQLAMDRGLLKLDDGEWNAQDHSQLLQELGRGEALRRRLEQLDASCSRTLLTLAVAGTPLTREVIAAAQGRVAGEEHDLTVLEHRGFVTRTGDRWEASHDKTIEAVLAAADSDAIRMAHAGLGRVFAADLPLTNVAVTARHLAAGGEETLLASIFLRWVRESAARGDRHRHRELAVALLDDETTPEQIRQLVHTLPLHYRLGFNTPIRVAAALGTLAALLAIFLVPTVQPLFTGSGQPTNLTVASLPLTVAPGTFHLIPAPVVEIRRANGAVAEDATDLVTALLVEGEGVLGGITTVEATDGRAVFDRLSLAGRGEFVLGFTADRLEAALSDEFRLGNEAELSQLRLVAAELNGVTLSPANPSLRVAPGESITGQARFRYTSHWGAAAVMFGLAPTWGDRATNFVTVGPLVTPAVNLTQTATIQLEAPGQPGVYHIIFAFQAEPTVEYIFSGTNWTIGRPIWNDGNDIIDWSREKIAVANATGSVPVTQLRADLGRAPNYLPATAIEVVVRLP